MKFIDKNNIVNLEELPNVGKVITGYLKEIGINTPKELLGHDPFKMYNQLSKQKGEQLDPCLLDVFISITEFMKTGDQKSWWSFTQKRKEYMDSKK